MGRALPIVVQRALDQATDRLDAAEAVQSRRGMPAGAATGGADFERMMAGVWACLAQSLVVAGCSVGRSYSGGQRMCFLRSRDGERAIYLPGRGRVYGLNERWWDEVPAYWGQSGFRVRDIVERHLGDQVLRFAPESSDDSQRFSGADYPRMFQERTTRFDFTIACVREGRLVEKLLFEYKSAKSSNHGALDGNAHERLSFQTLQYLEIANSWGKASLNVIASPAFSRYENKYHVSFNQHAIRLGEAFPCFVMRVAANGSEYRRFFEMIARWLYFDEPLRRDYRL